MHPQTWKTFVRNHLAGTIAIDFLTVPTVTFDFVYVFFVLSLERRRVLHVNVTAHPYAAWAAQQIVEALGVEIVPAPFLFRSLWAPGYGVPTGRGATRHA